MEQAFETFDSSVASGRNDSLHRAILSFVLMMYSSSIKLRLQFNLTVQKQHGQASHGQASHGQTLR